MRLSRISFKAAVIIFTPIILLIAIPYIQWGVWGLPQLYYPPHRTAATAVGPHGFPMWLVLTHFINFILIVFLIRSGLQILADHPRLYWNQHCTPGSEWLRLTSITVPKDRLWTAKDDSVHLSPFIGLPGYRHTIGMARHWHFLSVIFWVLNGAIFVALLFATDQWQRLVPTSWMIIPHAWQWWVHYAVMPFTLTLPPEPNGFYAYNALQQLSYFGIIFIIAPLAIITGPSMSPAFTNRFKWYPKVPGNRQIGRSIHFLIMCSFVLFIIGHVTMVIISGLVHNMNHITLGTDDNRIVGLVIGIAAILFVILLNITANWAAWKKPRAVQRLSRWVVTPVMFWLLNRHEPVAEFSKKDISPYFWPNGKLPDSKEWTDLADNDFKDYKLKIHGLVENPVELSLEDLRAMAYRSQITLHHCIQGWSGVAQWGGVPLSEIIKRVKPQKGAGRIAFYSFGDGVEFTTGKSDGRYYDSMPIEASEHPQMILALDMNEKPLNRVHGAPVRLRFENQLGFKMVKWISEIKFVASIEDIGKGEGGYAQDHEYFGDLANI